MARRPQDGHVTREHFDAAIAGIGEKFSGIDEKFASIDEKFAGLTTRVDGMVSKDHFETTLTKRFSDFKTDIMTRITVEMDRRFSATASQASVDALTAKVDRFLAALVQSSGEAADNRRTLIVHDAILGDHRRALDSHAQRLSALESRLPPPAP